MNNPQPGTQHSALSTQTATHFAELALHGIHREYPNKLDHVINGDSDLQSPRALHPAFYGCFDWHSSVHGHWMLVRLLRLLPDWPDAPTVRAALAQNLTQANLQTELAYLQAPNRRSFERTYGWAWLLKLAEELTTWDDPQGQEWARSLQPLAAAFANLYIDFLPKQTYPIRVGTHPNTAFGIAFSLDYTRTLGHTSLETLLVERALHYFSNDQDAPARWEPNGNDFFSPSLIEADLMRRVLTPDRVRRMVRQLPTQHLQCRAGQPSHPRPCLRPHRPPDRPPRWSQSHPCMVHERHCVRPPH